jgi:hypothetical protein
MAFHTDNTGGNGRPSIPAGHVVPVQAGYQRQYNAWGQPYADVVTFSQYWSGDDFSAPEADCVDIGGVYVLRTELPLYEAARAADPTPEQQAVLAAFVAARRPGWVSRQSHRPEVAADRRDEPIWSDTHTARGEWRSDVRARNA